MCWIVLSFYLFNPSLSQASLNGFENDAIQSIQLLLKSNSVILAGDQPIPLYPPHALSEPGETFMWQKVFVDVKNGKILSQSVFADDKPTDFSSPNEEWLFEPDKVTQIDHERHRVYIKKADSSQFERIAILFAGKMYGSLNTANLIENASTNGQIQPETDHFSLHFNTSDFPQTRLIALDAHFRIVRIEESKRTMTYEWKQTDSGDFAYVFHSITEIKEQKSTIRMIERVEEIHIDPNLPEKQFEITYPENYMVRDLRKLLNPPKF
ncbi:MAG: hypothetical protein C4527_14850 [Candidatus Omnitrophota bacterium]|jgi:hypothetical protein|nr:MAG: hypothetical protein C4527_14850 [Candidatus Omnitrophota bacterium]